MCSYAIFTTYFCVFLLTALKTPNPFRHSGLHVSPFGEAVAKRNGLASGGS